MTRAGKYLFTANTGSRTISRLIATGKDIDAENGFLGVIDGGAGQAHLSLFTYNAFGELTASRAPITLGAPAANGIAIVPPADAHAR